jgi:hypothetical protein
MTTVDPRPANTIPLALTGWSTQLSLPDDRTAEQSGLAEGGPLEERATWGPRIRPAVYEPRSSPANGRIDCESYDRGPIVEDLPFDPAAAAPAQLIMRLIVEVLARRRRVEQLADLVTPSVARCVCAAAARATHVRLSSVHIQQPHPEAVEAAVVCRTAEGSRALAARIDRRGQRGWCCTSFRWL